MKILITGSTGFVGKHLIKKINYKEHQIAVLVRDKKKAKKLFCELKRDITYIQFDTTSLDYKKKIKDFNPDMVIHLASFLTSDYDLPSLRNLLHSNIEFGSLVLDSLLETDVKYFINTGTSAEYSHDGKKLDAAYLYSATKTAFREILKFYSKLKKFKVVTVVPYTIYGGDYTKKKVIDYIIGSLNSPTPIDMTEGLQVLDFIHIMDVVDFYLELIEKASFLKNYYYEYHVGTGIGTSLKQLAKKIEEISNKKANINWGAKPYREGDIMHAVAPVSPEIPKLKWKPKISLDKALPQLLKERGF